MENKETMNLQQKLIAISNEMPKLLKKHYSDEVDYDFVKIDDIFELLNPAFTKYHICLQELEETDATYSKVDGSWIYTAKLTFFIVNADCLNEKERVSIQLVGDHLDSPAKAKGAAWTYGFKYFFLYKFRMKQETEDPDMKGTPPNGPDKSKGNAEQKKTEVPVKPKKSAKESSDVIADSPLSQPPVTDMNQKKENIKQVDFLPDPADFLKENEAEDTGEDVECHEVEREEQQSLEVTETSGSLNTEEETKNLGDMPTEFLESDDEGTSENPPTKDLKTDKAVQEPEKKENVSGEKINEEKKEETKSSSLKSQKNEEDFGQMNLLDFSAHQPEPSEKQETKSNEAKTAEGSRETDKEADRKEGAIISGHSEDFEEVKEEVPFEEVDEDDFFLQLQRDMESEMEKTPLTIEEAKKVICPYALFEGKTFGEMLGTEAGYRQLQWFAKEYRGSDFKMKEAAQLLLEGCEQKAA
ncbi:ERF family protein [[Ruminococcus] gnavus]|uniref:ERF family protein n=1 Tax=Mediterraneibacter gnavus TaxID=33038 RepID=UPI00232DAA30|nr:ERF family protein [Mediterraneibacter gnavus]MDB8708121.1 ERF family protein [Mediterraneibacter gnavus]